MQGLELLRPSQVRGWAYATAGAGCFGVSMCGSVPILLPSSFGICSALVCPRPPQAPMIESSSLTRVCPPLHKPRRQGRMGGGANKITTPSPWGSLPPRHSFRDSAKPPRNSRRGAGRRPAIRTKLRNTDASADEGDITRKRTREGLL